MKRRFIISTCFLCCVLIVCNSSLYHFTVICLPKPAFNRTIKERPLVKLTDSKPFTASEQNWLFAASAIGRLAGGYPAFKTIQIIGLKRSFPAIGLLSGVITFALPFFGNNFYVRLLNRTVQGFALCFTFLAIATIPIKWGSSEKSLLASVFASTVHLGPFLTMPTSGFFCESPLDWHGANYTFGTVTVLSFLLFMLACSDDEDIDITQIPGSSGAEPDFLSRKASRARLPSASGKPTIPFREIFLTPSLWGIMLIAFADTLSYHIFLFYGPIFINKTLGFSIVETGILSATPYLFIIMLNTGARAFMDVCPSISAGHKIKHFTSLSEMLAAICFFSLASPYQTDPVASHFLLMLAVTFITMALIGITSTSSIIAQQYNHIVTTALAAQDPFTGILLPLLVGVVAPHYSPNEWKNLFFVIGAFLTAANIVFMVITSVKTAKWTEMQRQ
ncbi:hypothetical protein QR680_015785 [Steinernema hermaphroditum]|uniref:Major facilitator superfamily (MFS) profile domain-containing protein n=1 Tax=Steinernema hermaphroditum TaxID=289476 RepID=A0AA39HAU2_9BILA|nr:hypothetical protein QR680_015785 [Steinernema hermaphroditum]